MVIIGGLAETYQRKAVVALFGLALWVTAVWLVVQCFARGHGFLLH